MARGGSGMGYGWSGGVSKSLQWLEDLCDKDFDIMLKYGGCQGGLDIGMLCGYW